LQILILGQFVNKLFITISIDIYIYSYVYIIMKRKKVIIGVLMAAIFVMMAFVPVVHSNSSLKSNSDVVHSSPYIKDNGNRSRNILKLKSYKITNNVPGNYMKYNLTFMAPNNIAKSGNIITIENKYGKVNVYSNLNYVNLSIILYTGHNDKISKVNGVTNVPDVNNGYDYCSNAYYKYPNGHTARLEVTKIEVSSLSLYTVPEIIAVFGEVVVTESGMLIRSVSSLGDVLSSLLEVLIPTLAADYALLYADAEAQHEPTIYLDLGASWGTKWYNFYQIGAYGEEGLFTGQFNSNNGYYMPVSIAGGHCYSPTSAKFYEEYGSHESVWNPYQEPPW